MFNELTKEIKKFNEARRWEKYHTPKNLATSVAIEAAELAKCFQWLTPEESGEVEDLEPIKDEIADILIYLINLCDKLKINPYWAVKDKLQKNQKRFPFQKGRD